MTALASPSDVEASLGRELTRDEINRVDALIVESSELVYADIGWRPDPAPDVARIVTARVTARVLSAAAIGPAPAAEMVTATMGPFGTRTQYNPDATTGGPWLTRVDKKMLRPLRRTGRAGNVSTGRPR